MLQFTPVTKLDRNNFREHIQKCGFDTKSCEYSYANLYAWSEIYNTCFAKIQHGYVIHLSYKGKEHYFAPITSECNAADAFGEIFEHEKSKNSKTVNFICMPKNFAEILENSFNGVTISTDRNMYDYIYKTQSLADFPGKAYHSKKNHRNKFFSLYGNSYEYKVMTAADVAVCHDFNKTWYELNSEYALNKERTATTRLLDNFERLGLVGGMIYVDGKLSAYTLASSSHEQSNTLIIHTEKGLYDIQGVYPTICSEFLKHEGSPYEFVNREDDTGDEGLRKSKLSYKPIKLEAKFSAVVEL